MSEFDTANLLDTIQGLAFIPVNQSTYSNDNLLKFGDLEIRSYIVPLIMKQREDYLVATPISYTIDQSNTTGYNIPTRAIGAKLKDVTITNSSGVEISIPYIPSEEVPYNNTSYAMYNQCYFTFRGNKVLLTNASNLSGVLNLYYFLRPSRLVQTTAVSLITSIDIPSKTVQVNQLPATFSAATPLDFVQGTPHFSILGMDQTLATSGASSITFVNALPTGLAVGDYVCLAGETPVPQIPYELHVLLAHRIGLKVLKAQGDAEGAKELLGTVQELEKMAIQMLSPRIEGENKKIVNIFGPFEMSRRPNRFGNF